MTDLSQVDQCILRVLVDEFVRLCADGRRGSGGLHAGFMISSVYAMVFSVTHLQSNAYNQS